LTSVEETRMPILEDQFPLTEGRDLSTLFTDDLKKNLPDGLVLSGRKLADQELADRLSAALGSADAKPSIAEKHVWALSGGGAKGAFQLGAAHALFRDARLRPVGLASTSVGSINALKLGEGDYRAVMELGAFWLGVRHRSDIYEAAPWVRTAINVLKDADLPADDIFRAVAGMLGGGAAAPRRACGSDATCGN
jgi:hypothetical protein